MKMYLLICNFYFDLVILTLLYCSPLATLKEADITKDAPVKTIPSADPEEAIDAAVAEITKEKWSISDGFDDTGGVRSKTSDDGELEERVEV
jgi:hypothetical protein